MTRTSLLVAAAAVLAACGGDAAQSGGSASQAGAAGGSVDLTGAGATFPYPLYSKWFADYARKTGVRINYQSIGSGGGIRQLSEGTVDFGASDSPMSEPEMAKAKGGPVLHFPTVLGAVVITYNLPNVSQTLKLTGPVLADIFLGRITKWNDPRIAQLNQGVALPATDVLVVRRSDGSGTTFIFTDYLAAVSPAWARGPSKGKEVNWPQGMGAKGNEGVAGMVKQMPGAIGYVELAYAKQNRLAYASIQNASGAFVAPSIESVTSAAAGVAARLGPSSDYRLSVVNAPGATAYPISSFTWLLVYERQPDATKGRKLADFLRWAVTEGQQSPASLDYAPLPAELANQLRDRIDQIQVGATT
ncbi:MAG: phosphate ABC transporter substrate-binding protein PstS [Gemmatimonadaceae bacterium]